MKEYYLQYQIKFICNNKNLETLRDVKSLGSTITYMEFKLILEDKLKEFNLKYNDVDKISYNYNREEDNLFLKQAIFSKKRLTKDKLEIIRKDFLDKTNNYFSKNKLHTFNNKDKKILEMFIELF